MLSEIQEKEQRLKEYKKVLKRYKISQALPFLSIILGTELGLCNAISHSLHLYPEIKKQRPENCGMYWFPKGQFAPRIEILKNAIEEIQQYFKQIKYEQ